MVPSKTAPATTAPSKLFLRMSEQMRKDAIRAAAFTLHNTVSLEKAVASVMNYDKRMIFDESQAVNYDLKLAALEARVDTLFKPVQEARDFSDVTLSRFAADLTNLLGDMTSLLPNFDLSKVTQALEEFRVIYESHDHTFASASLAQ